MEGTTQEVAAYLRQAIGLWEQGTGKKKRKERFANCGATLALSPARFATAEEEDSSSCLRSGLFLTLHPTQSVSPNG